jgi:hypothetical protein
MVVGAIGGSFSAGGSGPQRRPDEAKADGGTDGRGADQETQRTAMKTKMLGALCLAVLAVGASVLRAQPFQYQVDYTGPAVLLAADDHAERLLPGNPASRALELSVWQEESIAAVREGQRFELAGIAVDYTLTPAERRARGAEVVKAKGGQVMDLLTVGQRETLASWVEKERERVDMILGENLVERLQPFSWLSAKLGLTDEQQGRVDSIRASQRADIGIINGLTGQDPDDIKDRMNAMFLRHGEAVRALLTPAQVAQLDGMWSEVY